MQERFETFTVLINRISRNIRKIKNREMAEYHLRSAHISCLYYLYKEGKLTSTALCERCEEDKATISRALEYLEKNPVDILITDIKMPQMDGLELLHELSHRQTMPTSTVVTIRHMTRTTPSSLFFDPERLCVRRIFSYTPSAPFLFSA